jgi:hypothetical protein
VGKDLMSSFPEQRNHFWCSFAPLQRSMLNRWATHSPDSL